MRSFLAELLGTYFLVFAGTGALVINDVSGGVITHPGIAMVFGLVVMVLIYAFGEISGAHFNPAVTVGFWLSGRFPFRRIFPYMGAQFFGAILASLTLKILFPMHSTLGITLPRGDVGQSFILEAILTGLLVLVILSVTSGAKEKGLLAGVAIGGTVGMEALFAGPICGASMNPARSFAPAWVSGHLCGVWIYLLAPLVGACVAVVVHRLLSPGLGQQLSMGHATIAK